MCRQVPLLSKCVKFNVITKPTSNSVARSVSLSRFRSERHTRELQKCLSRKLNEHDAGTGYSRLLLDCWSRFFFLVVGCETAAENWHQPKTSSHRGNRKRAKKTTVTHATVEASTPGVRCGVRWVLVRHTDKHAELTKPSNDSRTAQRLFVSLGRRPTHSLTHSLLTRP